MRKFKAVLVDFDGTIVDSELANAKAYMEALRDLGFPLGLPYSLELLMRSIVGRHWSQFLPEIIGGGYSQELGERISARKRDLYRNHYGEIIVNEPLVQLVRSLSPEVKVCIVTNASRDSVIEILKEKGIFDFFSLLVCAEDVKKRKPDPESYFCALRECALFAEDCVAIEDSKVGIQSALAAGIKVLSFRNGVSSQESK